MSLSCFDFSIWHAGGQGIKEQQLGKRSAQNVDMEETEKLTKGGKEALHDITTDDD